MADSFGNNEGSVNPHNNCLRNKIRYKRSSENRDTGFQTTFLIA